METIKTIMDSGHKIFAKYTEDTIRIYQAYNDTVADCAVKNNRFSDGFSFDRMTWIKPSFLWLMYRSS